MFDNKVSKEYKKEKSELMQNNPEYPRLEKRLIKVRGKKKRTTAYAIVYGPGSKSRPFIYKKQLVEEIYKPGMHITNYQRGQLWAEVMTAKNIKYEKSQNLSYEPQDLFYYYTKTPQLRELPHSYIQKFCDDNMMIEFQSPNSKFFFFSNEHIYSPAFATKNAVFSALFNLHHFAEKLQVPLKDEDLDTFIALAINSQDIEGTIPKLKTRA